MKLVENVVANPSISISLTFLFLFFFPLLQGKDSQVFLTDREREETKLRWKRRGRGGEAREKKKKKVLREKFDFPSDLPSRSLLHHDFLFFFANLSGIFFWEIGCLLITLQKKKLR